MTFDFDIDSEIFDLEKFHKATGLSTNDKEWATVFYARNERTGYHVHFTGKVTGKEMELSLTFYRGSVTRPRNEPFAETAMEWLGSFFKKSKSQAWVYARFRKSARAWRSRFNLPFRVTMVGSNAEVVIEGISMDLPKNHWGAVHGWLDSQDKIVVAAVLSKRSITFSGFKIEEELPLSNEAIKIFTEEAQ